MAARALGSFMCFTLALAAGCGAGRGLAGEAEGDDTSSDGSSSGESDGGVDCLELDEEACRAESACEVLEGLKSYGSGNGRCVAEDEAVFLGCRGAGECVGSACLATAPGESSQVWVEHCSCLMPPWTFDASASNQPDICDCSDSGGGCDSWARCEDGRCLGCFDIWDECSCGGPGTCPPTHCCGWEAYCLPGSGDDQGYCP